MREVRDKSCAISRISRTPFPLAMCNPSRFKGDAGYHTAQCKAWVSWSVLEPSLGPTFREHFALQCTPVEDFRRRGWKGTSESASPVGRVTPFGRSCDTDWRSATALPHNATFLLLTLLEKMPHMNPKQYAHPQKLQLLF